MVKKVIMNLHLSKASGPDCILLVVLKNCKPKLSYILAYLFNTCLKESCFTDSWKVLPVVPVFKNDGKGLQLKTTTMFRPFQERCAIARTHVKTLRSQSFDCIFLRQNWLHLIKTCAYFHVTIKQMAIIDY